MPNTISEVFSRFPIIETDDLTMNHFPINQRGADAYYNFMNERDIFDEFSADRIPITKARAFQFVTFDFPAAFEQQKHIIWALFEKNTERIVGQRDLYIDSVHEPAVTQGYVTRNARNKGYQQQALNGVLTFLRSHGIEQCVANCSSKNSPAKHILEKFGFTCIYRTPQPQKGLLGYLGSRNERLKFILDINKQGDDFDLEAFGRTLAMLHRLYLAKVMGDDKEYPFIGFVLSLAHSPDFRKDTLTLFVQSGNRGHQRFEVIFKKWLRENLREAVHHYRE